MAMEESSKWRSFPDLRRMARAEPNASPATEPSPKPVGRWRQVWRVLRGEAVVPDQIRWEWFEYQQQFNDLLTRFSAMLARQAKAEKQRAERELAEEPTHREPAQLSKSDLRSMYGRQVAGSISPLRPQGGLPSHVPPPTEEP